MRGCLGSRAWILGFALWATAARGSTSPSLLPYEIYARGDAGQRLLQVAREALAVASGRRDSVRAQAPDWPAAPRPVFLTLARGGSTRACLGRDEAMGSLTSTVCSLAQTLLVADRRRPPVRTDELDSLRVCIAFMGDERGLVDPYSVDPMREGLRIETDQGVVAFLPGEARTVAWAIREARRIGVLRSLSDARFVRFAAVIVSGPAVPLNDRRVPIPHLEVHP